MRLETKYLTKNPYFRDGRWITGPAFRGFFLHSVGVGQPDPLVFIRQWNSASYGRAGINGFIGADAGVSHRALPGDAGQGEAYAPRGEASGEQWVHWL